MKPPAWRQAADRYPITFQVQTRYRDLDVLAHVNNTAIVGYYDEAREKLMRKVHSHLDDNVRQRIVTADTRASFLGELFHPDMVDIPTGILKIGRSSFEIGQALFQNGRCVGLARATLVQADEHGAHPLTDAFRAVLERYLIRGEG